MNKVWQSGGAVGDFVVSLIQAVWFLLIYTAATIVMVGQLDWQLAALVLVWLVRYPAASCILACKERWA